MRTVLSFCCTLLAIAIAQHQGHFELLDPLNAANPIYNHRCGWLLLVMALWFGVELALFFKPFRRV